MTSLQSLPLSALTIEDAHDFASVPLYAALERALLDDDVHYLVATPGSALSRWDHVALLNHAFWSPTAPDDVLEARVLTADVVAHRGWHHLAAKALGDAAGTPRGLMVAEAIASAFDAFMIGTLLNVRPQAAMLQTQVPEMREAMLDAGLSDRECERIFADFAADPRGAFARLWGLLYSTGAALCDAADAHGAADVLEAASGQPYGGLLHHYRLGTWVLYARGVLAADADDGVARRLADALAGSDDPLTLLADEWLAGGGADRR